MTTLVFGNAAAPDVLVQPVDSHDLGFIEDEVKEIRRLAGDGFCLLAVKADDWNRDLSPWQAPAVFGPEGFGGRADRTLEEILKLCGDEGRRYFIGGYSLAGLFALWTASRTDRFTGVAAASPSVWFPGFVEYLRGHEIQCPSVYLSLGDREEKTRNPVMAAVGGCIRETEELLKARGVRTLLEWNPGNHFRDAGLRTAKAFAWILQQE